MIIVPEASGDDVYKIEALVLKVFDGDGFLVLIKRSELTGDPRDQTEVEATVRCGFIDAPEMDQPGGLEAKAFLTSLIADRWLDLVVLTKESTGGSFDRFGRIVCVPYLSEEYSAGELRTPSNEVHTLATYRGIMTFTRNIELEMVVNGWAWVIERYEPDEQYFQALEDARHHRRGIWSLENNVNPYWWKRQRYRASLQKPVPEPPIRAQPTVDSGHREACPLDGCGGHLVRRAGRFGDFFGCSKYPGCRYTRTA